MKVGWTLRGYGSVSSLLQGVGLVRVRLRTGWGVEREELKK